MSSSPQSVGRNDDVGRLVASARLDEKAYCGVNGRDEDGALGRSIVPVVRSRGYYRYSIHIQKVDSRRYFITALAQYSDNNSTTSG